MFSIMMFLLAFKTNKSEPHKITISSQFSEENSELRNLTYSLFVSSYFWVDYNRQISVF